ncbi:thioesterase family protein [Pollutibacter soli]|uniref:acyl-CoA thioesterase n=1 Tax=Pollutibacter soli TaxID=3034157 RepID=UPI003013431A
MIKPFRIAIEVRWADLDPNFHMLHSKYYDFAAHIRTRYLVEHGFTPEAMRKLGVGPILFREECVFRRELLFQDKVEIDFCLTAARRDMSRFSFRHHIYKNADTVAAVINVDGAWIDLVKRKLTGLPSEVSQKFLDVVPKSEDFIWQEPES